MSGVPLLGVVPSAVLLDRPITFSFAIAMAHIVAGAVGNLLEDRTTQAVAAPVRDTGQH